jgi:hypothetical protein
MPKSADIAIRRIILARDLGTHSTSLLGTWRGTDEASWLKAESDLITHTHNWDLEIVINRGTGASKTRTFALSSCY